MTTLTIILGVALTIVVMVLVAAAMVKPSPEETDVRRAAIGALSVLAVALTVAFVLAYRAAVA